MANMEREVLWRGRVAPHITGMKLEQVPQQVMQTLGALLATAIALLVLFPLVGAWRQFRKAVHQ